LGGLALLVAFLIVEARSRSPLLPPELFKSRVFTGANLLTLLLYGGLYGIFFFLPFDLLQIQGYTATAAGLAFLPFSALLFLLSRWSGGLVDRFGARGPLLIGPLTAALGMALFAVPGIGGSYWVTFFPPVVILGIGMAITVAPLTTSVLGAVPKGDTGVASAINNMISRVAGLLAVALLGIFMLNAFSSELVSQLDGLNLPEQDRREIMASRTQLAAIEIDADLGPEFRASVRQGIEVAFISGFRRVMAICAALAVCGALIAWFMLRGEGRRRGPEEDAGG
jgi:predicted MFS family arabinose efflux permease